MKKPALNRRSWRQKKTQREWFWDEKSRLSQVTLAKQKTNRRTKKGWIGWRWMTMMMRISETWIVTKPEKDYWLNLNSKSIIDNGLWAMQKKSKKSRQCWCLLTALKGFYPFLAVVVLSSSSIFYVEFAIFFPLLIH